jgi:hypothetical protein
MWQFRKMTHAVDSRVHSRVRVTVTDDRPTIKLLRGEHRRSPLPLHRIGSRPARGHDVFYKVFAFFLYNFYHLWMMRGRRIVYVFSIHILRDRGYAVGMLYRPSRPYIRYFPHVSGCSCTVCVCARRRVYRLPYFQGVRRSGYGRRVYPITLRSYTVDSPPCACRVRRAASTERVEY